MEKERKKTFEELCEKKASDFEFAWNGFVRIYEDKKSKVDKLKDKGLIGCLNDTDVNSENYKKKAAAEKEDIILRDLLNASQNDVNECCKECSNYKIACVCMN